MPLPAAFFFALFLGLGDSKLDGKANSSVTAGKMPFTGLAPSRINPKLCLLRYRNSTSSPDCQAHFDQGLGYFYSYVWMEAARSFETAARYDPDCAMTWWGLSRALERWGKGDQTAALKKAGDLQARAGHREQLLIRARMQEKALDPKAGDSEQRRKAALKTLDELLALYDDDEEGWYARAQLSGGAGLFGGEVSAVPYYKALLRINPLHPGANHELVHFYEKYQRPALGWPYAENYIRSSPGIPHAFHMQAHLATRLGRWDKTSDRSAKAIELERAYHKELNVKPKDDQQYQHHLEILTLSLIHDGRFREAHSIHKEALRSDIQLRNAWFRLWLAERNWDEALKIAEHFRKSDKLTACYMSALVYLKKGDLVRAAPQVEVLRQAYLDRKDDNSLSYRVWETQGILLCRTGTPDSGLKLLLKAVEKSKSDYSHHAWGNGAYYMETCGAEGLAAAKNEIAEEAFLEALAHDPGSVRAAMGLLILCERAGRTAEAKSYRVLAERAWKLAERKDFVAEMASLRSATAVQAMRQ